MIEKQKSRGQFSNTLNIITADHGEFLGEHGFIGHLTPKLYNPGLMIPLIISYPEKLSPEIRDDAVSQVDILPTVVALLGLKNQIPQGIHGRDLFSEKERKDPLSEFWDDAHESFTRAIISRGHKLIVHDDQSLELYHLDSDPGEKIDLAREKEVLAKDMLRSMEEEIATFRKFRIKVDNRKRKQLEELLKSLSYIE
jgi:choline-sulfatase